MAYEVSVIRDKKWRRFKVDQVLFGMSFKKEGARDDDVHLLIHSYEAVAEAVHAMVNFLRRRYQRHPQATVRLSIMATGIDAINAKRVPLKFRGAADSVLNWLYIVLQSKKETPLDEHFRVHAVIENIPPLAAGASSSSEGEPFDPPSDPGMRSLKRFLLFPPDFSGELEDACLLTSLFLGMRYNAELRAAHAAGKRSLRNPLTAEWKTFQHLGERTGGARAARAREALREGVLQFCRELDFSPGDFRMADLESLRSVVDRIGINVNVFGAEAGYQVVFKHPLTHDAEKETVSIFLIEHPSTGKLHAGLIKQERKFLSGHRFCVCHFCSRAFETRYFPVHKCSRRENCPSCLFILARPEDYLDLEVARMRCLSRTSPRVDISCPDCQCRCLTEECFRNHKPICRQRSKCDECGIVYKRRKERPHRCGDTFCRVCFVYYDRFGAQPHVCTLRPPRAQSRYLRLVLWDTETIQGRDGEHVPNAVGVSYETRPGWFSEVCYFDRDMEHPSHGEVTEDAFFFKYWPDRMDEKMESRFFKPRPAPRPSDLFMPAALPREEARSSCKRRREGFFDSECSEEDEAEEEEEEEEEGDLDPVLINERLQAEGEEGEDFEDFEGSAINAFIVGHVNERFFGSAFLSHNGAKFDSILLLRALLKKNFRVKTVFDGNKLLLLEVAALKIFFMDSYRYLKMPLSEFSKRFPGMRCCEEKGIFPYSFNSKDNYGYEGPVPPRSFFIDRFTSSKKEEKVDAYLAGEEGEIWNFRRRMHEYLLQDVQILRGGAVSLLKEFFELQEGFGQGRTAEVPFHAFSRPFFTSSSLVHALWRTYGMPEDQIFLVENQRNQRKTSSLELEYLSFLNRGRSPSRQIRTAFNHPRGQKRVGNYSLDGFDPTCNAAIEFMGCAVHGHSLERKDCPLSGGMGPLSLNPYKKNLLTAQRDWKRKREFLEAEGMTVRCVWECEYLRMKETDPELRVFLEDLYEARPRERLALRDALRGGRTEAFCLLFDAFDEPDREMFYMDLNSLYPFVAINNEFPVGRPETFLGSNLETIELGEEGFVDSSTGERIRGTVQADLHPPDSVFIPVLPVHSDGKLVFGLCGECIRKRQKSFCAHDEKERIIRGTWTTVEVEVAARNGYRVHKIHEIVGYRKALPVFRDFYTRLATIKIESEGYEGDPNSLSLEEKEEQVRKINALMPGLNLKTENVRYNYPRRQFAKGESAVRKIFEFFFSTPSFFRGEQLRSGKTQPVGREEVRQVREQLAGTERLKVRGRHPAPRRHSHHRKSGRGGLLPEGGPVRGIPSQHPR